MQRPVEPAGAPAGAWASAAVELIRAAAVTAKNREIFIFVSCDKRNAEKVPGQKHRRRPKEMMPAAKRDDVKTFVSDCNTLRRCSPMFLMKAVSGEKKASRRPAVNRLVPRIRPWESAPCAASGIHVFLMTPAGLSGRCSMQAWAKVMTWTKASRGVLSGRRLYDFQTREPARPARRLEYRK